MTPTKKSNNKGVAKVAVVATVAAIAYWLFNRFKIEVKSIDNRNYTAILKITLGLKTIERTISGRGANEEFDFNKDLKVYIQRPYETGNIVTVTIFKNGEKVDYLEIDFKAIHNPCLVKDNSINNVR